MPRPGTLANSTRRRGTRRTAVARRAHRSVRMRRRPCRPPPATSSASSQHRRAARPAGSQARAAPAARRAGGAPARIMLVACRYAQASSRRGRWHGQPSFFRRKTNTASLWYDVLYIPQYLLSYGHVGQYDESTQIGYWIFDVFAQASGPVKAFAFLTMVKSEKMEMFGEKELPVDTGNLVGLLRLKGSRVLAHQPKAGPT